MGSLSDYSENKLIDLAFGAVAFTRPATVYGSLHTANLVDAGTGVEVSGTGYARKSITNNSTNFPAASGSSKALAVAQAFATVGSGGWDTITDGGLWDASSSGNLLLADVLTAAGAYAVGDIATFDIGSIAVSLGGAATAYLANKLLDHLLGGSDFTPPATWYLGLFVSNTEVTGNNYSRVAVTNNLTNFPSASGGAKTLATLATFPTPSGAWGTIDEVRIIDASSGGNTAIAKTLTTPRTVTGATTPFRFSAGALALSLS